MSTQALIRKHIYIPILNFGQYLCLHIRFLGKLICLQKSLEALKSLQPEEERDARGAVDKGVGVHSDIFITLHHPLAFQYVRSAAAYTSLPLGSESTPTPS